MRFGKTLRRSMYPAWRSHYIDYAGLKALLREEGAEDGSMAKSWSEGDEGRFVEELINVQLEKVNAFQVDMYRRLRERTEQCECKLEHFVSADKGEGVGQEDREPATDEDVNVIQEVEDELDSISREVSELERFSRVNFSGFQKIVKKHDRKRGSGYKLRPMLALRMAALPFNSEDYSPLLYRLSAMYSFVRQKKDTPTERTQSTSEPRGGGVRYTAYKFFVHPENLLEVKTYILRHLPVLVYNPSTSRVVDGSQGDPTLTSLYFDNSALSLYKQKVEKPEDASSLRLRWYGQLNDKPELIMEKKTLGAEGDIEEVRFSIKDKYVMPFIKGGYKMERTVDKIRGRTGSDSDDVKGLEQSIQKIQGFLQDNHLQPVVRASYTRTAFQIPGDDRIRISIDTNLALIRDDALDTDRPCRDPEDWHRHDIDDSRLEYPFSGVRKGEISMFPYAVLEIKSRQDGKKRRAEWVEDLMSSHLLKEAPKFSKFVYGIAALFEDHVNTFPFWMSLVDTDIRRDPEEAFEEEQAKKAQRAEDEYAVGSYIQSPIRQVSFKPLVGSPFGKSVASGNAGSYALSPRLPRGSNAKSNRQNITEESFSDDDGLQTNGNENATPSGFQSLFSAISTSKYARSRRRSLHLPPGIKDPGQWIKDSNPVRVEPKVWLANQRNFIKWQHITILLASLSLSLYNAAGADDTVARVLALVYTVIAVLAGIWGWSIYIVRSRMIMQRSGKDFDNVVGPIIVCISLIVALCLNFAFKYRAAVQASPAFVAFNKGNSLGQEL